MGRMPEVCSSPGCGNDNPALWEVSEKASSAPTAEPTISDNIGQGEYRPQPAPVVPEPHIPAAPSVQPKPPKEKKPLKAILICVISLLVIAAGIVAAVMIVNNIQNSGDDKKPEKLIDKLKGTWYMKCMSSAKIVFEKDSFDVSLPGKDAQRCDFELTDDDDIKIKGGVTLKYSETFSSSETWRLDGNDLWIMGMRFTKKSSDAMKICDDDGVADPDSLLDLMSDCYWVEDERSGYKIIFYGTDVEFYSPDDQEGFDYSCSMDNQGNLTIGSQTYSFAAVLATDNQFSEDSWYFDGDYLRLGDTVYKKDAD